MIEHNGPAPSWLVNLVGSNPVQTLIFFRPYFLAQLSSVNYRENRFHIHLTLINATGTKKKLWSVELLPKQRKYTQKLNDRC